jgi:hypothetical protein
LKDDVEIDFDEFVTTYNEKGKSEAVILARKKYDLSFQQIRRRLNNKSEYYFDATVRLYKCKKEATIESTFMTIDELHYSKYKESANKEPVPLSGPELTQNFDDLIKELIKDRLMELNKYVSINIQEKKLMVNTKNLKKDCFKLIEI